MWWKRNGSKKQSNPVLTPQQIKRQRILDDLRKRTPSGNLCFGPMDVYGAKWSGVVVWYRPAGYHSYKTLTLLGVWACVDQEATLIIVGTRPLPFTAPFYDPEAYFYKIPHSFDLYYGDDAPPPEEEDRLLEVRYNPAQRLALRDDIEAVLAEYVKSIDP
jgi:hypothetical protein